MCVIKQDPPPVADHRSDELFLMSSIWSPVAVIGLYLYFVKCVGPRHMKNRPAYELNGVMKAYNLTQILCSVYMLLYSLKAGWAFKYKWLCEPVDYSFTASSIDVVRCVWTYMMIKLLDLVDTVFFVLRKKAAHTSFLHVYHHAIVFFGAWCCTKYVPGGHGTFIGPVNAFVHIVMYTYYFVTATWPEYRKSLWWKKYITQLQLAQFLIVTLHSSTVLFMDDSCKYPKPLAAFLAVQNGFMFILFAEFYVKSYRRKIK
ncbi:hypothetical protein L798_03505 [Zootermopsis nevadensis]|uniref:Elongation of very long chain fatty acids protein n=1 Tax=Zootermopsis nevadensis TaxID=136037 RepID=A0A067QGD8_ZOONE|nr:hypothetical protein L798_03505 [Zootermopsis nevadensis]